MCIWVSFKLFYFFNNIIFVWDRIILVIIYNFIGVIFFERCWVLLILFLKGELVCIFLFGDFLNGYCINWFVIFEEK